MTTMNLIMPLVTVSSGSRPTLAATNRLIPRGGVMNPIARFTTMMTPKWIGFIPMLSAIGSRIGDSTIIAGVVSMKQPTIRSSRLISSRIST